MTQVLLATCAELPDGDEDGPDIVAALGAIGISSEWRAWDDGSVNWSSALVVVRATWDYTLRRDEFLAWAASVPRLVNPYDVVLWNSDKTYLTELHAAGVPVTPTTVIAPGASYEQPDWPEVVVKPSVGAGSRGAGRFPSGPAAEAHVRTLHAAGRTALLQPFLTGVDTAGETALVYVDGAFSHAVRKGPLLAAGAAHGVRDGSLYVEENITARGASRDEIAVGDAAMRYLQSRFGTLLYARIDLLPGPDGPVVVEAEITEPSLFLSFGASAFERFATAIAARL